MKTIVRLLAIALVLVLLAIGGLVTYVDQIAETAVEQGASSALGVETSLGAVHLGFVSGEFSVENLAVANPSGFAEAHFLRVGRTALHLPLPALLDDPIVIPRIELRDIELNLERSGKRTNYGVILDNLEKFGSAESSSASDEPAADEDSGRRFVIHELSITGVTARAGMAAGGADLGAINVDLPEIELTDVGTGNGAGIPMEKVVALITRKLLEAVAMNGSGLPAALTRQLGEQLGRFGLEANALPKSTKEMGQQIEKQVTKKVQKQLQEAVGQGGGLFKGLPNMNKMLGEKPAKP